MDREDGILLAVVERTREFRLPRALQLKERVARGETLNDNDLAFLHRALEDCQRLKPLFDRHPEYQQLAAQMVNLFAEITGKGLENESDAAE